jgi:dolichol-phosphate mannosyltransferase
VLFGISVLLGGLQISLRILFPDVAPKGVTTTILLITLFGSLNLLGLSIIGEYISKIFEEVKRRPHFIRRNIVKDGEIRNASVIKRAK